MPVVPRLIQENPSSRARYGDLVSSKLLLGGETPDMHIVHELAKTDLWSLNADQYSMPFITHHGSSFASPVHAG
jgi:hypothetical protein